MALVPSILHGVIERLPWLEYEICPTCGAPVTAQDVIVDDGRRVHYECAAFR